MQFAGQISGVQLGFSLATLFDPQSQADSPVLTVFFNLMTLLIFLQLNVHHWILRGAGAELRIPAGGHRGGLRNC